MVEVRLRPSAVRRKMAPIAARRETRRHVIGIFRSLVVSRVTSKAVFRWRAASSVAGVAIEAIVSSLQRKHTVVAEISVSPVGGRVAVAGLAVGRETDLAMVGSVVVVDMAILTLRRQTFVLPVAVASVTVGGSVASSELESLVIE